MALDANIEWVVEGNSWRGNELAKLASQVLRTSEVESPESIAELLREADELLSQATVNKRRGSPRQRNALKRKIAEQKAQLAALEQELEQYE